MERHSYIRLQEEVISDEDEDDESEEENASEEDISSEEDVEPAPKRRATRASVRLRKN